MSESAPNRPQTAVEKSHRQVAEAVLLWLGERARRAPDGNDASLLIWGPLEASAARWLFQELNASGGQVRLVRARASVGESSLEEARLDAPVSGPNLKALDLDRDVLAQGFGLGEFDLLAVVDFPGTAQAVSAVLANLKRLLKRDGLLVLEMGMRDLGTAADVQASAEGRVEAGRGFSERPCLAGTQDWKTALVRTGFQGVMARSDASRKRSALERELLIARSDGQVEMATGDAAVAASQPGTAGGGPPEAALATMRGGLGESVVDGASAPAADAEAVREQVLRTLGRILQIPLEDLDVTSPFTEYGVDSIAGVAFVNVLNRQLGTNLKPTVLFDYASVEKLTAHITEQCRPAPAPRVAAGNEAVHDVSPRVDRVGAHGTSPLPTEPRRQERGRDRTAVESSDAVAIIGMAGRFPGAASLDEFWQNLALGRSAIREVPRERWDHSRIFDADSKRTDKTNSKWGGFLADADKFDPLFFNISGREAEATDPQHRLFLEECYHALEDAGYTGPSSTRAKKCGVFAGVEPGDYLQVLLRASWPQEKAPVFQGNAESILAARISYFLDLKGPSLAVNTACSSSLVAIHLACRSLANGDCDLALAGGVRVFASEKAYLALGNMGMLSPDGQCRTFDEGANGFVPGEAVGVIVLKSLAAALRDGDHIHGVIKGSAVNQDGKTNGITAPSSLSQTQVELEVYENFSIDPRTIQYVEAHGTGTKLGDPIEVQALTQAFVRLTPAKGFCAIGSVKTNIGHTMAAAGVCSVIKVLLALRHRAIPPSLNLSKANPYIDFENSPFFVNTELREWGVGEGAPRRAAISSFGFSGTNCHLVIEEAPLPDAACRPPGKPAYLVAVSAKTAEALRGRLRDLIGWLKKEGEAGGLEDISFTLNDGRGHFAARCAAVAGSVGELAATLTRVINGEKTHAAWQAESPEVDPADAAIHRQVLATVLKELRTAAGEGATVYREKLAALGALYVKGYEIDWGRLHDGEARRRISLPVYPFARERYWVTDEAGSASESRGERLAQLHPLVHRNVSTLSQTQFASRFDGREFFLNDHQINGQKVLPGVACLELAAAAARLATGSNALVLANVAWMRPVRFDGGGEITIHLERAEGGVRFELVSGAEATIHAQGKIILDRRLAARRVDVGAIQARCGRSETGAEVYRRCREAGLDLGPSFQSVREVWFAASEALSRLELPASLAATSAEFALHPSLMDGALQTTAVLGRGEGGGLPVPFAVGEVAFTRLAPRCYAHVERVAEERGLLRFHVTLLDETGEVLAELKDLAMRPYRAEPGRDQNQTWFVRSVWRERPMAPEPAVDLTGRLLLFDTSESFAGEVCGLGRGLDVVRVVPGKHFEAQTGVIQIDPDRAEDFERLLDSVQPDFVMHLWAEPTGDTDEALRRGIYSLFYLTRALIRRKVQARIPLLFVHPPDGHPAYAAVNGYARTLRLERPNLVLKVLETADRGAMRLLGELVDVGGGGQIRQRAALREVRDLEIFSPTRTNPLALREKGVYLITGGAGGLGMIFAEHLAAKFNARLVLTGRSELTPARQAEVAALTKQGGEVLYVRSDVTYLDEITAAVGLARKRFGRVDGVIHAAGVIRDEFILRKERADFAAVLAPKVDGVIALDAATVGEALDFFVVFSSIAGVFGNVGQADYAFANGFLDEFARSREERRRRGERSGRTLSLNWPLWRDSGMRPGAELERIKLTDAGLTLLDAGSGLEIFEAALTSDETQVIALRGHGEQIRTLLAAPEGPAAGATRPASTQCVPDQREPLLRHLTEQFSAQVKLPAARIQPREPLEKYGIDSIMVMEFTQRLETFFGDLSKTLLFEHQTLDELAGYFLEHHAGRVAELLAAAAASTADVDAAVRSPLEAGADRSPAAPAPPSVRETAESDASNTLRGSPIPLPTGEDIAIIGVFGRYPMADDLDQFWDNLRGGRDCIIEIPPDRWDYRLFYDAESGKAGKTVNKWGGFLNQVDRFDPQFFNITPREAIVLDPQERLFLETVWRTVEDAGYRKSALANKKVGVYVGVMYGEYQLYAVGDLDRGEVFPLSSSYASIANRVSYFFNWHGPSLAVDTMCSSSLTAIHLACESLRRGESELAVAGGVNTTLHPHKDILLSPGGFAATDGRCRSFGEGGDGYVPGEGVGAVLLKPLSRAVADGDHIHAVVRASAVNHGGKTNGYTVPNPKAQADLIHEALAKANLDPRTIGYIEAHGTGTALGDPIEISALTKAFRDGTPPGVLPRHGCAIGSVKSNIGHLESAAGIAGVTKVLLQLRHGKLVPSLHSEKPNPNIDFQDSPFCVQLALADWAPIELAEDGQTRTLPRRAGISSFGAGGANAHLILEEYVEPSPAGGRDGSGNGVPLVVLAARNLDRLRARVQQLHDWLLAQESSEASASRFDDVTYTLQVGREPLEERLAFVAVTPAEAIGKLRRFLEDERAPDVFRGSRRPGADESLPLLDGDEGRALFEVIRRNRKWDKLAQFWVAGGEVDWEGLYAESRPRRVPLPSYPFLGERYWAPDQFRRQSPKIAAGAVQASAAARERVDLAPSGPEAILYRPVWREQPLPALNHQVLRGRLLLFDAEAEFQREARAACPGLSIVRVAPGEGFAEEGGLFRINPQTDADYQRLVEAVRPDFIVHRWSSAGQDVDRALESGVYSVFKLAKALMARALTSPVRLVYVYPPTDQPAFAAVGAFAKTLVQEQPKLLVQTLEVEHGGAALLAELLTEGRHQEVRWRDGKRQIRELEEFQTAPGSSAPFRRHGVYVITGGLGGLGMILAEHLASTAQARLVLSGRSALTEASRVRIAALEALGAEVLYVPGDISRQTDADGIVRQARERFGRLHGVIHAAGLLRDAFILKKVTAEFADVLAPKVHGALALDAATREDDLDFFVLFSSTAGVIGNVGQCDYAYANGFLDAFAHIREGQRAAGQRHGRTFSINWPLWREGGMKIRGKEAAAYLEQTGLVPLPRATGVALLETILQNGEPQVMPLWGMRSKLNAALLPVASVEGETRGRPISSVDDTTLAARLLDYLGQTLAAVTHLPVDQIHADQRFEDLGVDSIVIGDFNLRLGKDLGALPKTLLFEHSNLRQLTAHMMRAHKAQLAAFFAGAAVPATPPTGTAAVTNPRERLAQPAPSDAAAASPAPNRQDIAVVGLAGRYPQANDLEAFWENLRSGKDSITEIPKDRWDIDHFFDPDPAKAAEGKIYCRWGAFLDDVDKFDPLFFNLAPLEAELMDPQERLFLETAWAVLEDAGYTRQELARWARGEQFAGVGVFVGVTTNTYQFVARDNGGGRCLPTSLPWSIANRVSYWFNFTGPSMPVDTACSSSLTAIHLACEAIRKGECGQAIAGGVNLYLHPAKYVSLCLMRMLSTEGKCRTFGAGGDGFVPGEGVGAVLLKPLAQAIQDGDHVYGIIRGTAVNHGGRTNGYTVPNPTAQADLIAQAIKNAQSDPRTVSYVEAHGTGTVLGDPIEVAGLEKAFEDGIRAVDPTIDAKSVRPFCALGSVKSNIGHLEAAAGIAGLTKVLLQLKHRQLAPSLNADPPNPHITFGGTPFAVQQKLEEWRPPSLAGRIFPRRAGISSFGAGGANAHVIVEEYVPAPANGEAEGSPGSPVLIPLSARNADRLQHVARRLESFMRGHPEAPLRSLAFTLQTGREALDERVAFVVSDRAELLAKLARLSREGPQDCLHGRVKRDRAATGSEGPDGPVVAAEAIRARDLEGLARLWVSGVEIEWRGLWVGDTVRRLSLPSYPFARERYWVPALEPEAGKGSAAEGRLHPLVHRNESTLRGQVYGSRLGAGDTVLNDHRVNGQPVLPGAATLELAMAAFRLAGGETAVRLREVVWLRPVVADANGMEVKLVIGSAGDGQLKFELCGDGGLVYAKGNGELGGTATAPEVVDLAAVRSRCSLTLAVGELYRGFADRGLAYGPAFQAIRELGFGEGEVWSELEVPASWGGEKFWLHPGLVDGALQSLGVIGAGGGGLEVPFGVRAVECGAALPSRCYAYGRVVGEEPGLHRYDVKLLSGQGEVLARLEGLTVRRYQRREGELLYYRPVWEQQALAIVNESISGPVLVLDDEPGFAQELATRGLAVVRVVAGEAYAANDKGITLRRGCAEDYDRLVAEVKAQQVIHRWSRRGLGLDEALELGIYSLHRLVRALVRRGGQERVRLAYVFPGGEPAYEAVAGYARSVRLEAPHVRLKTVELETGAEDMAPELLDDAVEVRYWQGRREVRGLEPVRMAGTRPLRLQDGVYLISGGAGGLGMMFAERLVKECQVRLVLVGRSELSDEKQARLAALGDAVTYVRADVSELAGARQAVAVAQERYGRVDGVVHAAGELRDGLIWNKQDFEAVLRAKVRGLMALDAALGGEANLVLFSSTAGLLGNAGQSDYAYANAYLDAYAQWRTGQGRGRVVSINWPLWRDGGMRAREGAVRFQAEVLGMQPLEAAEGWEAFQQALRFGGAQCAVFFGLRGKLEAFLERETVSREPAPPPVSSNSRRVPRPELIADLKRLVSKVLRLDPAVVEPDTDLGEYGFDSITFTTLADEVNSAFGLEVTPASLFEYTTLEAFADFLQERHGQKLASRLASTAAPTPPVSGRSAPVGPPEGGTTNPERARSMSPIPPQSPEPEISHAAPMISPKRVREPIAVVGMSGIFPGSPDLDAFWRNLDAGKDLISRAPGDRWTFSDARHRGPGSTSPMEAPWGGFIGDVDKFDPLFFDISPREAELMDPQQRLFLQTVWKAIEDAGHRKSDLAGTKTGLFVGVAANDYASLLALAGVEVEAYSSTGNAHSVLANRASYFFDLRGPSEAIDTACSSSLVAIHRAIESIESGSSEMALVGGVNVLLSPGAFQAFAKAGMLCPDGRCKTFDERANGYVRGEGVGVLLLKPLSRARRDGDRIHALILGSAENHGGHVQSLTVPNPNAQAQLLQEACARAGIDPYTIGCIEAHGTGTSLGDPIEINGLKKAFGENGGLVPHPRCAVGSVKTNVGHLETAAGIAGVIKVLLAMRQQRIPGNVHLQRLNRYIEAEGTPFHFPQRAERWDALQDRDGRRLPRRAGVSSFGFGGANAHVVLEEYVETPPVRGVGEPARPELIVLSARDGSRLRELAAVFLEYLESRPAATLASIARTLQVGREPMAERLGLTVGDLDELRGKLKRFVAGEAEIAGLYRGNTAENKPGLALLRQIHDGDGFIEPLLKERDLPKLAQLWVTGWEIAWEGLRTGEAIERVRLPTYPFARERYWVPVAAGASAAKAGAEERSVPVTEPDASPSPGTADAGGEVDRSAVRVPSASRAVVVEYLVGRFAALVKMPAAQIKPQEPLEKFGFDSILAVEFSERLEEDFGELSKTLLFEYQTLDKLADYFLQHHAGRVQTLLGGSLAAPAGAAEPPQVQRSTQEPEPGRLPAAAEPQPRPEDIAIIGLFGRYPMADNLEEFWSNLVSGRDCIEEIPGERWDYRLYYDPERGKPGTSSNKWGGFMRDVDKFDPLFFNISPREAEIMDPQERLFLETVWNTVEDAGYSKSALGGRKVGVFVGVMYGQYQLFGVEESMRRGEVVTLNSSYASIANRVSYFFDWQGASVALDAMCSSALMSVHLACESLRRGESELAIAGGVNVILHPHKDVGLSQAGFLNPEGRCRSFGKSEARGYVAGEGVGAALLKPLSCALRDRDHLYGVIKATAVNHGGKTNGYTLPNPNAQADLVSNGLRQAGVDPRTISYLEAAATGSALGDPIEVTGLTKAFRRSTEAVQFCAIGSVKSNIGHLESASGIAGLTKVLLQMKHQRLVPSIHTAELNPSIHWTETPFFVQRELIEWGRPVIAGAPQARRACVNAFGAGGSNAHLVVEEPPDWDATRDAPPRDADVLIVLSARNKVRLVERAASLASYLRRTMVHSALRPALGDVAYTLQVGREAMEERLAFVAASLDGLVGKLDFFVGGREAGYGLYRGNAVEAELSDEPRNQLERGGPAESVASGGLPELARLWVAGRTIDWERLYVNSRPRRISLPTYPFARERYWFNATSPKPPPVSAKRVSRESWSPRSSSGRGEPDSPIVERVRRLLGVALKLDPGRISLRRRMVDYGLDSVTTVAFLRDLEQAFTIRLTPGAIVEHPTLASLAEYLCDHHAEAVGCGPGDSLPGGADASAGQATSDLVVSVSLDGTGGGGPSQWTPTLVSGPARRGNSSRKRRRKVALAPMDYLFVGAQRFAIQALYYFERPLDFGLLRRGLQRVAEAFYPVNAQLVGHGASQYVIRECAGEADFQEVICEAGVLPPQQDCPASFEPFEVDFNPAIPGEKLAKFRLFQLSEGSLLSVNLSHAVADGYSYYYFLSSWASACRGEAFLPPDHSRGLMNRLVRRYLTQVARSHQDLPRHSDFGLAFSTPAIEIRSDRLETLTFDPTALVAELKETAGNTLRDKLTENSVVTALVWKAYAQTLGPDATELVLACPIDFRRICGSLSPAFFGNAAAPALTRWPRERVLEEPVATLAATIFDSIRACDEQAFLRFYASLERLRATEGREAVERLLLIDPRSGLIVTNVSRFPHEPVDFGSGLFSAEFAPVNYAGTAVIVNAPDGMVKVRLAHPALVTK